MKRICIYLTYDSQNIVDKYIGYMLNELKKCCTYLIVVCNELEILQGKDILEKFADIIFYRDNIGFDAGAFKDVLCNYIGWNKIYKYDELILVNDSFFGPFISLKNIFKEMDKKAVDFWGLTKHGEYLRNGFDYFPEHIQSFFIAIRYRLLHNTCFKDYWENMPYYKTYNQVVREYEMKFTSFFLKLGYTYDVYSNIEINDSLNPENNYCQYGVISYELIIKRKFPFFKKQQIVDSKLEKQTQENLRCAIDYIDKYTSYDVDLIWENLIRTLNMTDLQKNLHFQYIIQSEDNLEVNNSIVIIAVFIHCKGSAEYIFDYLKNLNCPVKIILENQDFLQEYVNLGFECVIFSQENRKEILAELCKYDLACIINDTDLTTEYRQNYIGKSYFFNVWNNLVKDERHIQGIIKLFEKEKRLGVVTTPQPNFENYFGNFGKGWDGKFEKVQEIVKEKNIVCQLSEWKAPFRIFEDFWIRGNILTKVVDWEITLISYLPYLWIYIAQDAGYYSGIVESPEYASMNEVNLQYYLNQIAEQTRAQYGDFKNFMEFKKRISQAALSDFYNKHRNIYIYGTGIMAREYRVWLPQPKAYIVSDGQVKLEELDGIPVKYLSEIEMTDDSGIVLCLNKKHQSQVIEELERRGIKQYFCV